MYPGGGVTVIEYGLLTLDAYSLGGISNPQPPLPEDSMLYVHPDPYFA
jgi:hypothetical protein